jgi:hypothetical protein
VFVIHETKRFKGYLLRAPRHESVTTDEIDGNLGNQGFLEFPTQITQTRFMEYWEPWGSPRFQCKTESFAEFRQRWRWFQTTRQTRQIIPDNSKRFKVQDQRVYMIRYDSRPKASDSITSNDSIWFKSHTQTFLYNPTMVIFQLLQTDAGRCLKID